MILSDFNPEKLFVAYMEGTTATEPVVSRHYTLTHSDFSGILYLNIGQSYAWEKINPLRDEVLAEWIPYGTSLFLNVYVYVDQGEYSIYKATKRDEFFRRELPLALTAIRYGDHSLFNIHSYLDTLPIIINFISTYPQLARQESWGTFQRFLKNWNSS